MKVFPSYREYLTAVSDLLKSPVVLSMSEYKQHGDVSCLEHCIFVSYISFLFCRKMGWNFRSAARGGLLHDLFLYDWHEVDITDSLRGFAFTQMHGFTHPITALNNANEHFTLDELEQDIIKKHMWRLFCHCPAIKRVLWFLLQINTARF